MCNTIMNAARLTSVTGILMALCVSTAAGQEEEYDDRLARIRDLTSNSEMILLWTNDNAAGPSDEFVNMSIHDLDLTESDPNRRLVRNSIQADSLVTGNRKTAVAAGNFLGGQFKHFVGAWIGANNSISVVIPEVDAGTLSWSSAERLSIPGPASTNESAPLHVATGDFLGSDQKDEFVVAYEAQDGTIHLHAYEFPSATLVPAPLSSIADEAALTGSLGGWQVVTGDYDGDGRHEIALVWVKDLGSSDWSMNAKVYDVDPTGALVPGVSAEVFPKPAFAVTSTLVSATSGDFDSDPEVELAFAFTLSQDDLEPDTYVYLLDISRDLSTIAFADTTRITADFQNENVVKPMDVAAGDLDGDQRDELVLAIAGGIHVYTVNDNRVPTLTRSGGSELPFANYDSDYFLDVSDMDADGRSEFVTVGSMVPSGANENQYLIITVTTIDANTTFFRRLANRQDDTDSNNYSRTRFAMALGDFDADRMWLGPPQTYTQKAILRPTVVLNTPPVHYDVLDGTTYDLSACFPGHSCGFSATYTQTSANELTVSFETHEDWGASATISSSVEALKTKATTTYGEKFSLKSTSSETKTITTGRVAAGDDWIYASTYDIDLFEYPVFDGADPTPIGYFIVSIPGPLRPLWIEAKDDELLGNQFRPDHEVGNVLSYRKTNTTDMASPIVEFQEQTVGSTGSSSASLLLSSFTQSDAETSWDSSIEVGVEVGFTADIFGIELGGSVETAGTYSLGEITTQTVKVESSLEMRSDFGSLDQPFGTSGTYQITPYAYWTQYGAIAIDYKVSLPTGPNSFWQQSYGGKTDPGFSLPWRYDVEKGNPLPFNDPSYVMRSRDIVVSPPDPEPGDTVRIGARVRNMGLENLLSSIAVDFYDGDPSTGGVLIASSEVDSIDSQGSQNVFVEWAIPSSASLVGKRVYVVLDGDDRITDEVHVNNNVGWAPVLASGTATNTDRPGPVPSHIVLHQNFPNPFRDHTTIAYELPWSADVRVTVYDVLGRLVKKVVAEWQPPGGHQVRFDAGDLPSGLYLVQLRANHAMETRHMVMVR